MLYPSIDSLLEKLDSKYTLVTVSSRRARILRDTGEKDLLLDKVQSHKQVGKALEEIAASKLSYERREE